MEKQDTTIQTATGSSGCPVKADAGPSKGLPQPKGLPQQQAAATRPWKTWKVALLAVAALGATLLPLLGLLIGDARGFDGLELDVRFDGADAVLLMTATTDTFYTGFHRVDIVGGTCRIAATIKGKEKRVAAAHLSGRWPVAHASFRAPKARAEARIVDVDFASARALADAASLDGIEAQCELDAEIRLWSLLPLAGTRAVGLGRRGKGAPTAATARAGARKAEKFAARVARLAKKIKKSFRPRPGLDGSLVVTFKELDYEGKLPAGFKLVRVRVPSVTFDIAFAQGEEDTVAIASLEPVTVEVRNAPGTVTVDVKVADVTYSSNRMRQARNAALEAGVAGVVATTWDRGNFLERLVGPEHRFTFKLPAPTTSQIADAYEAHGSTVPPGRRLGQFSYDALLDHGDVAYMADRPASDCTLEQEWWRHDDALGNEITLAHGWNSDSNVCGQASLFDSDVCDGDGYDESDECTFEQSYFDFWYESPCHRGPGRLDGGRYEPCRTEIVGGGDFYDVDDAAGPTSYTWRGWNHGLELHGSGTSSHDFHMGMALTEVGGDEVLFVEAWLTIEDEGRFDVHGGTTLRVDGEEIFTALDVEAILSWSWEGTSQTYTGGDGYALKLRIEENADEKFYLMGGIDSWDAGTKRVMAAVGAYRDDDGRVVDGEIEGSGPRSCWIGHYGGLVGLCRSADYDLQMQFYKRRGYCGAPFVDVCPLLELELDFRGVTASMTQSDAQYAAKQAGVTMSGTYKGATYDLNTVVEMDPELVDRPYLRWTDVTLEDAQNQVVLLSSLDLTGPVRVAGAAARAYRNSDDDSTQKYFAGCLQTAGRMMLGAGAWENQDLTVMTVDGLMRSEGGGMAISAADMTMTTKGEKGEMTIGDEVQIARCANLWTLDVAMDWFRAGDYLETPAVVTGTLNVQGMTQTAAEANRGVFQTAIADAANVPPTDVTVTITETARRRLAAGDVTVSYEIRVANSAAANAAVADISATEPAEWDAYLATAAAATGTSAAFAGVSADSNDDTAVAEVPVATDGVTATVLPLLGAALGAALALW
jgi:hypothetical protein